jgi:hypothetical protein
MRLGEMLIRDGRISQDQLAAAIEKQRQSGGKIGSIFVELGFVDVETLTVYLGLELGIPIANGPTLERCKRSAVKLLTPYQAARLRCVPIVIQGQTLVVAIDDPHDMVALDELSAITGYRILPRVAPEVRIYYYLERFYGVRRPRRFAILGESIRGSNVLRPDLPASPLPGLPSIKEPRAAPTPPPVIQRLRRADEDAEDEEILELDAADLVIELDADDTEPATTAPAVTEAVSPKQQAGQRAPPQYDPIDLDRALTLVREAQTRNDIARALICYAAGEFDLAALFMVRDELAFGLKALGPELQPGRVDLLCLPLSAPSVLQAAASSDDGIFYGSVFPSTLHSYLFRGLGCFPPTLATAAAIRIGDRTVNVLYGHREALEPPDVPALRNLSAAASEAYIRMITGHKRARRQSGQMIVPAVRDIAEPPEPETEPG